MTRRFKLLQPVGEIPAGTIAEVQPNNMLTFAGKYTEYSLFASHAADNADWYQEITEPEMVWQKPENLRQNYWCFNQVGTIYQDDEIAENEIQWFSSEQQATQFAKHLEAAALLRAAIERVNVANGNWKPDWSDNNQDKRFLGFFPNTQIIGSFSVGQNALLKLYPDCYYFGENTFDAVIAELGNNATQIIKDFLMID